MAEKPDPLFDGYEGCIEVYDGLTRLSSPDGATVARFHGEDAKHNARLFLAAPKMREELEKWVPDGDGESLAGMLRMVADDMKSRHMECLAACFEKKATSIEALLATLPKEAK